MFDLAFMGVLIFFVQSMVRTSIPILFAALGEIITEKAGVLNIGIEGIMLMGAFVGFAGSFLYDSLWVSFFAAVVAGFIMSLIFAFFSVTLKTSQIVVGVAFNLVSLGLTGFLYRRIFIDSPDPIFFVKSFKNIEIPFLTNIPIIGEMFFKFNLLVYLAFLLVPVIWILFYKTSAGIVLTSTGEHPEAVDSLGINVFKVRYFAIIAGGIMASVGGCFLSVAHSNQFAEGMSAGRGFIALAVVILGKWNPWGVLVGALIFGGANSLQLLIQTMGGSMSYDLVLMIPYVLTVIAVIAASKRKVGAPSALVVPYEKS